MAYTAAQKIIKAHLVKGQMITNSEIAIKIDQTLTQDSTGTMAYLQFEAMGIDKVKTKKSVAYIDHNVLQTGSENADDHLYIQTVAKKHGIYFSKPGNGICHQVHLERFGVPGETLLGSDSHTPTGGGLGMLAIGAGGIDVAVAMGGGEYHTKMPKIVKVDLVGKLSPWVSAKDIVLEILRRLTVKGGVNKIFEYAGEGLNTLSVPERATIANMGAELGCTTSIFPSDEITYEFLKAQGREKDYVELKADDGAVYDEIIEIDLNKLQPLIACPHSPDKVVPISSLKNIMVDQVLIGSCTNSSYVDMMMVSKILKGKTIPDEVSLAIAPGSKQTLNMLSKNGALGDIIDAGARVLESACGPCIGMGQAPSTGSVSLRTFNRNFKGRSGTTSANVYIVSPEVAVASALTGYITDPRELGEAIKVPMPEKFLINDNLIIAPAEDGKNIVVKRGPNIKSFPKAEELKGNVIEKVLIKLEDNITTDDIMPSNAKLLPFRSNIPYLAEFCLTPCDAEFPAKAKKYNGGIIIAGSNYGQGSSREHAALSPLYLGIKAIIAKSFARIHKANLINNAIIPLVFENPHDYDDIAVMNELIIEDVTEQIKKGIVIVRNITKGSEYKTLPEVTEREKDILIYGGLINSMKRKKNGITKIINTELN